MPDAVLLCHDWSQGIDGQTLLPQNLPETNHDILSNPHRTLEGKVSEITEEKTEFKVSQELAGQGWDLHRRMVSPEPMTLLLQLPEDLEAGWCDPHLKVGTVR